MKADEVMREVHEQRDGYVNEHGNDIDAIFSDLRERQQRSKREIVDLADRKKSDEPSEP